MLTADETDKGWTGSMIKLVASDIDGTLLPEGTDKINPEIFGVIRQLKEKGIIFAAASGRHYTSMRRLFEPVKDDIIFIGQNGASVTCRGCSMQEYDMDWQLVCEWVREVRQIPGISFNLETRDRFISESTDPEYIRLEVEGYKTKLEMMEDVLAEEARITKMSIYHKSDIQQIAREIKPRWADRMYCTIAGDIWLDFMHPDANKGNALRGVQKALRIRPEETMAFGDNENDVEMLRSAGESYAVANAVPVVKEAARHMTDSNVNDGVLKVLKTLL